MAPINTQASEAPVEKPKPAENLAPNMKPGWYRLTNIEYFADSTSDEPQKIISPSTMTVFKNHNFSLDGFGGSGMPIRPWQEVELDGDHVTLKINHPGEPPKKLTFSAEWYQDPPF